MMDRWQAAKARFWVMGMPILIGLFLVVLAAMGIFYFQQQRERDSLDVQLDQLRTMVASPVEISDELTAEYEENREALPSELETDDVVEDILSIAQENGFDVTTEDVTITPSDTPRNENIEGTNYQVFTFELKVSGDYRTVTDFMSDLDSTPKWKTLVIESLDIDIAADSATAQLEFGVYVLEE